LRSQSQEEANVGPQDRLRTGARRPVDLIGGPAARGPGCIADGGDIELLALDQLDQDVQL